MCNKESQISASKAFDCNVSERKKISWESLLRSKSVNEWNFRINRSIEATCVACPLVARRLSGKTKRYKRHLIFLLPDLGCVLQSKLARTIFLPLLKLQKIHSFIIFLSLDTYHPMKKMDDVFKTLRHNRNHLVIIFGAFGRASQCDRKSRVERKAHLSALDSLNMNYYLKTAQLAWYLAVMRYLFLKSK